MSTQGIQAGGASGPAQPVESDLVTALAAELRELVSARWPMYYPGRKEAAPEIVLTPRHFGFSIIFQVDLAFPAGGGSKRFMIKIRRQQKHGSFVREELSDATIAASRAEYAEHLKAYRFFDEDPNGLSVVRPLDYIESHNAFVVEHASGQDLSKLVRDGSPIVEGALSRCGAWWRMFHRELHEASERDWDPRVIDGMLDRRFTRLHKIGAPVDSLFPLREEISAAARRVQSVKVPVSLVHGDCKLRHVWATSDGIQVLDFGNAKVGDSWIDPAALVVELSLYSLWTRRMNTVPKVH